MAKEIVAIGNKLAQPFCYNIPDPAGNVCRLSVDWWYLHSNKAPPGRNFLRGRNPGGTPAGAYPLIFALSFTEKSTGSRVRSRLPLRPDPSGRGMVV